ncbi:hypothetical protein AVEN_202501-1 [Araneus ventricosus]|uniref:Uncharacterized protein n=1 Tax=Araneus ventricosus TaxID=182803 RepID=A0A4Y2TSA9_ARAVE|nr:hypothetical protein AVEN_64019-1 [Araneus ventricosus]GBO02554.1 hypothetical protein AVEN_202501-1 [Araneus ventricosus]
MLHISLTQFQTRDDIIKNIVQCVYGPTSRERRFIHEYSGKLEAQITRKEQHLHKLTTQTDSKSLIIIATALAAPLESISFPIRIAGKTPKRVKDVRSTLLGLYLYPFPTGCDVTGKFQKNFHNFTPNRDSEEILASFMVLSYPTSLKSSFSMKLSKKFL